MNGSTSDRLRRQRQIDQQQTDAENRGRLPACLNLLERNAGPCVAELCGSAIRRAAPISAIACPVLKPGAAAPLIVVERNRLKWLITCGPAVSHAHDARERHHLASVRPRIMLPRSFGSDLNARSACTSRGTRGC